VAPLLSRHPVVPNRLPQPIAVKTPLLYGTPVSDSPMASPLSTSSPSLVGLPPFQFFYKELLCPLGLFGRWAPTKKGFTLLLSFVPSFPSFFICLCCPSLCPPFSAHRPPPQPWAQPQPWASAWRPPPSHQPQSCPRRPPSPSSASPRTRRWTRGPSARASRASA
jgi:hypothetical protein